MHLHLKFEIFNNAENYLRLQETIVYLTQEFGLVNMLNI